MNAAIAAGSSPQPSTRAKRYIEYAPASSSSSKTAWYGTGFNPNARKMGTRNRPPIGRKKPRQSMNCEYSNCHGEGCQ